MNVVSEFKKAKKGNNRAFERLIVEHKTLMFRAAMSVLHNEEDSADAIQEAILKAYRSLHSLREPGFFKTWLLRIVMNESYQIIRKHKKVTTLEDWNQPPTTEQGYLQVEIDQMLRLLPEDQAQLLTMFYIEGMTSNDLAQILQIPENTVKTRIKRAKEKIRNLYEEKEATKWKNGKNL